MRRANYECERHDQGDQIGQIFAPWAIVFFELFLFQM
jgi:hypothetical protein